MDTAKLRPGQVLPCSKLQHRPSCSTYSSTDLSAALSSNLQSFHTLFSPFLTLLSVKEIFLNKHTRLPALSVFLNVLSPGIIILYSND